MNVDREDQDEEIQGEQGPLCRLDEPCPWCDSTGDIQRTKYVYWGTVLAIVVFLALLYIFAVTR